MDHTHAIHKYMYTFNSNKMYMYPTHAIYKYIQFQ